MKVKKTKKNYYKLFCDYCRNNGIWFSVCADGCIDTLEDTLNCIDFEPCGRESKFGTKAAYDWLVREHEKLKGGE